MISMTNTHLRLVAPAPVKPTVTPRRRRNSDYRSREHLTEAEVEKLIEAVKGNRYGHRDATMVLIAFRHGLRVAELVGLRWDQVDFEGSNLHVVRRKRGSASTHPISGRELRALRRLKREAPIQSPFIFMSERGSPFSVAGFQKLITRAGVAAGFEFQLHPHMLRHACGYKLANDGHNTRALQAYLGHKNIQHTVRYTELSPTRFNGWWKD
jgi:integrase